MSAKNDLEDKQKLHKYPMIELYSKFYEDWRIYLSRYFHTDLKNAKCMLTKLFYGGVPDADIPFMWALKNEIDDSVDELLAENDNMFGNLFQDRRNPKYTKFAYMMAELENNLLESILEKVQNDAGLRPISLIYDGSIIEVKNDEDRRNLEQCIRNAEEAFRIKIKVNRC